MKEKEIFKAEIDRLKEETSIGLSEWENGVEHGRMEIINALYKTLDSMQEEPVSDDLEKVAIKYAEKRCYIDNAVYTDNELREAKEKPRFHFYDIAASFMEGVKWQQEQMMKHAAECKKANKYYVWNHRDNEYPFSGTLEECEAYMKQHFHTGMDACILP